MQNSKRTVSKQRASGNAVISWISLNYIISETTRFMNILTILYIAQIFSSCNVLEPMEKSTIDVKLFENHSAYGNSTKRKFTFKNVREKLLVKCLRKAFITGLCALKRISAETLSGKRLKESWTTSKALCPSYLSIYHDSLFITETILY